MLSLPGSTTSRRGPEGSPSHTEEPPFSFQNDLYWNDWSQLSIFRASKQGGSQAELLASQLPGLMDMKVFYKGKTAGKGASSLISLVGLRKGLGAGSLLLSSSAASASLSQNQPVTARISQSQPVLSSHSQSQPVTASLSGRHTDHFLPTPL